MAVIARLIRFILGCSIIGLAGVTVLGLLGFAMPELDLINHFQFLLFLLALLAVALVLLAFRRSRWKTPVAVASLAALAASGVTFLPEYVAGWMPRPPMPADGRPVYRLMTHNIFGLNYDMERVRSVIAAERPDIIALQEFFPEQSSELDPLLRSEYPYVAQCKGGKRANIAIYSRLPFAEQESNDDCPADAYGRQRTARIVASFEQPDGTHFSVMTTHLDWPVPTLRQTGQFAELGEAVARIDGPLLLVGDFNSTPWSYALRDFAMRSELTRQTHNLVTFPTRFTAPHRLFPDGLMETLPLLPLDHVMTRGAISIYDVHRAADTGSDHLPVVATFSVSPAR